MNEVTWKLTDGRGSIAWSGDRSGGYRTTRAVAWLMGIGNGLWVVRYRNKASRPMKLNAAKTYAIEMVKGIRPGRVATDPIAELNRMMAASIDGCPVEAIGAEPPAVTLAINEDGTYRLNLEWAGQTAEYGSEDYPEDAAIQTLHAWGFRGNFAMRWENGQVATYKRIPWPPIEEETEPPAAGPDLPIIDGRINGIFDTLEELEAYQRGLSEPALE